MFLFNLLILVLTLHVSSSISDESCSYTDMNISSCSNQTCRLSSLDLLTIPPDLTHNMEVDIQLCSQHSELRTEMKLRDLSAVHLAGEGGEVQCIGEASGITFIRVHSVWLENIKLRGCGVESSNGEAVTTAGIFIIASAEVMLDELTVTDSPGVGIAMRNVSHSDISDCTFTNKNDSVPMKSGLHITVSEDDTSHTINGCVFIGVEGVGGYPTGDRWTDDPPMAFTGAGLRLSLLDHATNNSMLVKGCLFAGNSALDGGAMHITVEDSSEGNSVNIERSEFTGNCAGSGGGAIAVGFLSSCLELETPPTNNKINIVNCNFTRNSAFMGGAVHLFSSEALPSCVAIDNEVVLDDCMWEKNMAHFGAAIDARSIKPQHSVVSYMNLLSITLRDSEFENHGVGDGSQTLPLVVLKDCKFTRNTVVHQFHDEHLRSYGAGAVRVEEFRLSIRSELQFSQSTGSALYLDSATVEFAANSQSCFENNVGYRGGAISITGHKSAIHLQGNASILFRENRAGSTGGAISQPSSDTCFITSDYREDIAMATKAELVFEENTAVRHGQSLFVGSLEPCNLSTRDLKQFLDSIATFTFIRNGTETAANDEVSTLGRIIISDKPHLQEQQPIPGKEVCLGVHMLDDTNTTVAGVFLVSVRSSNNEVSIASAYIGNGRITFFGPPGTTVEVRVVPIHRQSMEFRFETTLSDCPPGFYYDNSTHACACSANSRDSSKRYVGIRTCQLQEFRATLLHSIWAGYDTITEPGSGGTGSDESGKEFKTAYCPRGFCRRYNQTENDFLLPGSVSGYNLTAYVCRNNRKGILCARCKEGHSVFYPTYYTCEREKQCELGWLYYIISQILPATILFSVVIAFDISLTDGAVNGFIFYTQMFDILVLTANDFLWFEKPIYEMLNGLRFTARVLNLRFFGLRRFSFCLWKGADSLDAIAVNYVTVLYSFFMVVFTVKVLNPCILKIWRRCRRRRRRVSECKPPLSIIHGLSGFLVLCYSHSTTVSLYLIAHTALYGQGRRRYSNLAFYNGELEFFSGRHLAYAIPATVFLVLITVLPPILLLSYPLCYKVLALCGMEESRFTKLLCRAFPLERYKPFFDSFQGAFKDKHRYFAGVYFVYRLVWLLTFAYIRELASFYVVLEVELVVMLALNAYVQPYKNNWHNRLDTCIFLLLAIINASTIYHYNQRNSYVDQQDSYFSIRSFQLSIAYLPLFYMCGYLIYQAITLSRKKLARRMGRKKGGNGDEEEWEMESLSRMYRRHSLTESSNSQYQEFEATTSVVGTY